MADMRVDLCGIKLKNPLIAASGTFGFGREYSRFFELSRLGGISVKGLTREPRQGNKAPRVAETPSGMLNAVGLQNPGVEAFMNEELPWLKAQGTVVIANIAGSTEDDYAYMARRLRGEPVDMLELNISCPNIASGGAQFGNRPGSVERVTRLVKAESAQPLMVKLSPNVADIAEVALAAEAGGADCLSLINTLTGMAIDVHQRKPLLGNVIGGLSGPAIMPIALRMVWQAASAVKIPVVGMGGIITGEDAVAFMLAGAKAVMVGTATIIDPPACMTIIAGIEAYMQHHGVKQIDELVGALEVN